MLVRDVREIMPAFYLIIVQIKDKLLSENRLKLSTNLKIKIAF